MKKVKAGVLYFLFSLLILESVFAIHEYGHLREFQKRNVPIEEYSLGIGPPLYQYQTDSSSTFSFRLIPIMAYVSPTEEGEKLFTDNGSLWDKLAVSTAGVRNNFLAALAVVLFLQILGWRRGNLTTKELARNVIVTPLKIFLRFFAFLIGCLTLGRVNLASKFLLSTGGIVPPKSLNQFIFWNLTLGFINLAPVFPLDGGRLLEAFLSAAKINIHIPTTGAMILFIVYFVALNLQDMRLLQVEVASDSSDPED